MTSIHEIKRREIADTPVLLFDCQLTSGVLEHWSTHQVTLNGETYRARVVAHNLFDIRAGSDDGIDAIAKLSLTLANADSYFSQIDRSIGWKGAKLTVRFVFFDLKTGLPSSEDSVIFRGLCNPPDETSESTMRLSFVNRLSPHRVLLPEIRIQRRCPWMFPSSDAHRQEAVAGGAAGRYSPFYRCGYSAGQTGGAGNMNGGTPFTSCDYTRTQCEQRGMLDKDNQGKITRRFGGVQYLPSSVLVKTFGDKSQHVSAAVENEAKYNDFVPLLYGRAWYRPPVIFARNDGNLTRLEVLLGAGEMNAALKVIANGVELPAGVAGRDMTSTGWYNVVSLGARNGDFNQDFVTASGTPAGDPYGSMAILSVVIPNRISDGTPLPRIEVLAEGLKLATFAEDGELAGEVFTNNPAWVLLDVLRRSGWSTQEIDLPSFARTATYCDEPIATTDLNGNSRQVPRFQCNLVLRKRRSAADVIRGVRNGAGLYLTYGPGGRLQLNPESSFAVQQPTQPEGSNSTQELDGGWPAYEFGDGSSPFSDILRRSSGEPALRLWSRSTADTPNRFTIEFQDEFNEYQQDSLSLVDLEDALNAGQEISAGLAALGFPNFNQAGRIMRLQLDKSIRGNTYVEFETGLRAIGLKPGDLITLTYLKEGFERQPFRILRISPGLNYRTSVITAQIHQDAWYTGDGENLGVIGGGRQPGHTLGIPRPLLGDTLDENGDSQFSVAETAEQSADGTYSVTLQVGFSTPGVPSAAAPGIPLLSLAADVSGAGGTLKGGRSYYYAISGIDADGNEGPLSFVVRAAVPEDSDTNSITLGELSFAPGTSQFHVYRGANPEQLLRIAAVQELAATYTDSGDEDQLASPPDRNYHHANFYWRLELLPESPTTVHSANTIGNSALEMLTNEYRGKVVRIMSGAGRSQERTIIANTADTLTINRDWETEPDNTSTFVVAESGWQFGAVAESSPAVFDVPNRRHAQVHVSGRAANVHDREAAYELSPLTRHEIGGGAIDFDVPDAPVFGITSPGEGLVEVSGVGFENLINTRTITAASLTLHYWNELSGATATLLASPIDEAETTIILSGPGSAEPGTIIQVGHELMKVEIVAEGGGSYVVERGVYSTNAAAHVADDGIYHLERRAIILPFLRDFFGTPASGSYAHVFSMPDVRIVLAEMYMTNAKGHSQVSFGSYAGTLDRGLRTLSGGQFSLQVDGQLAVQSNAVPVISIDAAHAVRDVFATIAEPPIGSPVELRVKQEGETYCSLLIEPGQTLSNVVDGIDLPPLQTGAKLGLDIIAAGQAEGSTPGRGLTVTVRL